MSVDERLRRAFEATDPTWSSRAPGALREVTARHRRRVVLQRAAAAVTAVAAVGVGVLALSWNTDDRSAPAPATELPTRESPFPLDGTWVSQPISRGDVRRAAAAAGDEGDLPAMLSELPALPFRIVMVVDEERNSLLLETRRGDVDTTVDEENVTLTDGQMVLRPRFGEGQNVHTWSLEDGVLILSFVSTTESASGEVPVEAWQRLLYDAATFTQ